MAYDRYKNFRMNGVVNIPFMVKLTPKNTDYFEPYVKGSTRLDLISYDYYGDPNYDWLILMANPELSALEYAIPDGTMLRIPYPLADTLENYNSQIERYVALNGIE